MRPAISRRQMALGVIGVLLGGGGATLAQAPATFTSAATAPGCGSPATRASPPRCYEGKAKSIGYQYPHSIVVGASLWVIHAINKEDIELSRIHLTEFDVL